MASARPAARPAAPRAAPRAASRAAPRAASRAAPRAVQLQTKLQALASAPRLQLATSAFNLLRNLILALFLLRLSRQWFYFVRGYGFSGILALAYQRVRRQLFSLMLSLPGVGSKIDKEVEASTRDIEAKLIEPDQSTYVSLPSEPWPADRVRGELGSLTALKRTRWEEGKVSGAVYHGQEALIALQHEFMHTFSVSNPIHADVFPAVRKMEAEIVAMVLSLFNGPASACGATTSGGTESILMACLSARQKAAAERGVTAPEMIVPQTAHAAFHKAANYFKIKLHLVPCPAPDYTVSLSRVKRLINPNTVLLVGSCPNYPHGIVDPIAALSKLAVAYKLPLHVDCCLGSFLVPLLGKAGFPDVGAFDFRAPGVSSISVDTHKYGFAPKGNSCILYRNRQLRQYQYFVSPDWCGGIYGSPSMAGSRAGALIAGCWATLMSTGLSGYVDATNKIVAARVTIQNAISEHPVLKQALVVIGKPAVSVVAFTSQDPDIDIYEISDAMSRRHWHLNSLQDPPGLHVAVTVPMTQAGVVDSLIDDLVSVVKEEKAKAVESAAKGEKRKKSNTAQLYGVAGSLPDKRIVNRLVVAYLDTLYKAD